MKAILFLVVVCLSHAVAAVGEVPLIPREILWGNPVKDKPMISPGGTRIAYLANSPEGVLNIWVASVGKKDEKMVTHDTTRGVFEFFWGYSDDHILFLQDNSGDENDHLKSVDLKTGKIRDLTPFQDVRATNILKDDQHPEEVMVGLNRRDPRLFDMYRVHLVTGAITLEAENPGDVIGWTTDREFRIRAATAFRDDLSTAIRIRDSHDQPWRDLLVTPFERTPFLGQYNGGSLITGFDQSGKILYAITSLNSDTTQLVALDTATGKILQVIAADPQSDLVDIEDRYEVMNDKETGKPLAAAYMYFQQKYKVLEKSLQGDFALLEKTHSGVFHISSRDARDNIWIVHYFSDTRPEAFYVYQRQTKKLEPFITSRPDLEKYKLAEQKGIVITARDGMKLPSFLTLPPETEAKNLPLVLLVHGGPWFRDYWGFDPEVQWMANRGYAVLQVNFRGSTGFGVKHLNAGTGGWCTGSMQQDLNDAVDWAIKEGIADPKRIAIYGGSYGGYATLCGIVFSPDRFVAAVEAVGVSDVAHLLSSFPPYWKPVKKRWIRRIGVDVENDEAGNKRISPLHNAEKIRTPLFIAHGSNDPRVKQEASDRIVAAMRAKNLPVTYIVYPDEGHGFERGPNRVDYAGRVEEFFARYLKGRLEPVKAVPGTSAQVK